MVKRVKMKIGELVGVGIYSVPEAGRLARVSPSRIRRWLKGYSFKGRYGIHASKPIITPQIKRFDDTDAVGFHDLLEIRFVNEALNRGLKWVTIRLAHYHASRLLETDHPFCSRRLKTDGVDLFTDLGSKSDSALVALSGAQNVFGQIIGPFLQDIEFGADLAEAWWPRGRAHRILVDPARCFGKPIVSPEGVPTAVLADAFATEKSFDRVAQWYEVPEKSVREAVEFEKSLAA
jgi:uncharacterized protein (DUF433 family)